jgi:Zn2+/Cd2+-exporting ATPase
MSKCQNKDCCCGADVFDRSNPIPQVCLDTTASASVVTGQSTSLLTEPLRTYLMLGIGVATVLLAEGLAGIYGKEDSWLVIALSLIAIAVCGIETYRKGLIAVKNFNLNMNALMSIAVTGAIAIGQWTEGAMVMVLFSLAEVIEDRSLSGARKAVQSLMALSPDKATVQQLGDIWNEVEAKRVPIGTLVRVQPGERIPLDGEIVSGQSTVNQSPITGESIPVSKALGDMVFAGTINEYGSFDYRSTALANHSMLSRIIQKVEEARTSRAPTQRFIDSFSRMYTPVVLGIALLVATVPPLVFGLSWTDWIYRALVLMVIACPCALVISTPITIVSALAAAAKAGILIKGGTYLEAGHKLQSMAFDKTGTITIGKPSVTDVIPLSSHESKGLRLAAALACRSDHPVSSAINVYWKKQASVLVLDEVSDLASVPGRGIKGRIRGHQYFLGNHQFVKELGLCNASTEGILEELVAEGKSAVVLCDELEPLMVIGVMDTVRESSRKAVADLHLLGIHTLMLTGDNSQAASTIAVHVGIDDVRGNLLPEDKLTAINAELIRFKTVGMVGDGINDAPAMAKASIAFAMGAAGSDAAIEIADVALMDDDLLKIPQFIRLSSHTVAILRQNITIALGIKAIFFAFAIAGKASLWMAVFADMGTSLMVVFNGLRLLQPLPKDQEIRI